MTPEERAAFAKKYNLTDPQASTGPSKSTPLQKTSADGLKELEAWRASRSTQAAPVAEEKTFAQKHPVINALSGPLSPLLGGTPKGVKDVAVSIAKPIAETAIQFPRALASGVAGTAGTIAKSLGADEFAQGAEQTAQNLAKPVNVPILGEVKPLSAVPGEAKATDQLGQSLEIAANLAGAEGAGSVIKAGVKGAAKQAAVRGAIAGGEAGLLSGTGTAFQEEKPTASSIIKGGLEGAIGGALLGGGLGAAGAKLSDAGRAATNIKKLDANGKKVLDLVSPELSKAERATAIAQGRGTQGGLLSPSRILANNRSQEVAQAARKIVDPKKGLIPNVNAVRNEISREADSVISSLENSGITFDQAGLEQKLSSIEKPLFLKADDKLNKVYDLAQGKFMEFVSKEPNDLAGLLKARKSFDGWIEEQLPKVWEDPTSKPLHSAVRSMRSAANDFISEALPAGNTFKDSLKRQNLLYEAADNMSEKAAKGIGTNKLQQFAKNNPRLTKGLKYGAQIVGAGAVGNELFGTNP